MSGSTHVGREVGCRLWRAAGRCWVRLEEPGAPGPGLSRHTRLLDNRPSQPRRARLSPATPHGPSPGIHAEQSPSCSVCGSSGSPVRPPSPLAGSELAGERQGWQRCPAASPAAARWVSQRGYLELRYPSRDTASLPVCADPKTAQPAAKSACFSLQREPWEPPDDKPVTHPLARKGRGNCWDTQDLQSSLHTV